MTVISQFLYFLLQAAQPLLVTICFVTAWTLMILLIWGGIVSLRQGIARARKMHQIPCSHCRFFTGDYRLKCAVHPKTALSEEAINCPDYQPAGSPFTAVNQKNSHPFTNRRR